MTKFKVGDRVRYIGNYIEGPPKGWAGVVREASNVFSLNVLVEFDHPHPNLVSRLDGTNNTWRDALGSFEPDRVLTPLEIDINDYIIAEKRELGL